MLTMDKHIILVLKHNEMLIADLKRIGWIK